MPDSNVLGAVEPPLSNSQAPAFHGLAHDRPGHPLDIEHAGRIRPPLVDLVRREEAAYPFRVHEFNQHFGSLGRRYDLLRLQSPAVPAGPAGALFGRPGLIVC